MNMTVYDFLELCIDRGMMTVEIWSNSAEDVLWTGPDDELPEEYEDCELCSFDPPTKPWCMTLNIE